MLVTDACFNVSNRSEYQLQRYALLTEPQRNAIIGFLEYLVDHAEEFNSQRARKSLERHWRVSPER